MKNYVWIVEREFNGKTYPGQFNFQSKKLAESRKKEMKAVGFVAKIKVSKYIRQEEGAC